MPLRTYPLRILLSAVGTSVVVLAVAATLAVYLNRVQGQTADILGENIGSRRAAADLEETRTDLVALHRKNAGDVEPLQDRVQEHLAEIERFSDKEQEKEFSRRLAVGFAGYRDEWRQSAGNPGGSARLAQRIETDLLPVCRKLREYNSGQIEESERRHRASLSVMSWGLAVVGGLGSVAGVVLGYGLARGLRRTIHQLLIRVQGASDLLSQELPAVEWSQGPNDLAGDDGKHLLHQVEQVVQKLQQREREVRRAERLAAVGRLAAGVAHEVRNPLTSIKLLIQTSRRDPAAGGLSDEDLDLIEQEIQRLERSVRTFLDYARPPKLERTACDLARLVRGTLGLVRGRAESQHVQLRFSEPEPPPVIDADAGQVQQVLVNLTLNALDAMPHGGTLTIGVTAGPETAEITVTDTGPGVAADVLPRLFEPFATNKETGLGLGLVVSKRIVEDHGGTITARDRPGGGACFAVRLPVRRPRNAP